MRERERQGDSEKEIEREIAKKEREIARERER